jgi:hypothetical protein
MYGLAKASIHYYINQNILFSIGPEVRMVIFDIKEQQNEMKHNKLFISICGGLKYFFN